MKYFFSASLVLSIMLTIGCKKEGVSYKIHTHGKGKQIALKDFITVHLQQATQNDSVYYSSYNKTRPQTYSVGSNTFNNLLTEGLLQMHEGDSVTFWIPADSIFKNALPKFINKGEQVKYTMSILKVQNQEAYNKERIATQSQAMSADKQKIDEYIKTNNLTVLRDNNGIAYTIIKQGSGESPKANANVKIIYTTTLLNGSPVESTKGAIAEVELLRQPRGMRQAISLLNKGGKGKFILPSFLCYGSNKRNNVPPDSPLVYEVELVDFNNDHMPSKIQKQLPTEGRLQLKDPENLKAKMQEVLQKRDKK